MTSKITITLTEKEQEKIEFLLEDTGIRTAEDLLVFLMNKEYKRVNERGSFPAFSPAMMMDTINKVAPNFFEPPGHRQK